MHKIDISTLRGMHRKEAVGRKRVKITEYIEYEALLTLAEGRLSGGDVILRFEKAEKEGLGDLIVSDVIMALSEYMPEVSPEWIRVLFVQNAEINRAIVEEYQVGRLMLGWMFANNIIDLHKKTGNA